jgi:hypothetical protein
MILRLRAMFSTDLYGLPVMQRLRNKYYKTDIHFVLVFYSVMILA